ncbi:MAG: ATP-grasp domain-containing protein [Myxococcales bacterium]|nr:ATP-grasp domain-containing protein [Myxococcales bacterium]
MQPRTSVLLVEEGWHSTLPLARALEDADHAVTVLTANGTTASCSRKTVRWTSGPTLASAGFAAHLDRMVTAARFDHVLPLTEDAMRRLWAMPVTWRDRIFPQTAPWQRSLVADKHALVEHMRSRGIAIPRHRRVDDTFDLDAAAHDLGLPLVVKSSTGCGGRLVRIVDTRHALAATLESARRLGGDWIVQEYVPSTTYLVGGVFHAGEPVRIYAAEKLAQDPARVGGAVRLRSTHDPALVELGVRVVRELRWTGFASVDFVRSRAGSFLLLEVNPRLWGSHAGALAAGVDLMTPFAQLLAGETPPVDLAFTDNVESWIFPQYLAHRSVRTAVRGLRDLVGEQGRDWRDPRFALYTLRRARRMRRLAQRL